MNYQYNLDLGLKEIFFIYTLKMNYQSDKFFLSSDAHSLQLVVDLPTTNKGALKCFIILLGEWGCASNSSNWVYRLNHSSCKSGMYLHSLAFSIFSFVFLSDRFSNVGESSRGRWVEGLHADKFENVKFALKFPYAKREFKFLLTNPHLEKLYAHLVPFATQKIHQIQSAHYGYDSRIHKVISDLPRYARKKKLETATREKRESWTRTGEN